MPKRVKHRDEVILKLIGQPSVIIKIIFASAISLIFILLLYHFAKWFGLVPTPEVAFGMPFGWFEVLGQIVLFAAIISVFTKIFLINPIDRLKKAMKLVEKGDFDVELDVRTADEIGELSTYFNQMIAKIARIGVENRKITSELKGKTQLERKGEVIKEANKELAALVTEFALLHEIGQSVNSTMEITELYRLIQEVLPTRLHLHKFAILCVDEKREFLNVRAAYGFGDTEHIFDIAFRIGEGVSGEAYQRGELIYVSDIGKDKRYLHYRGETEESGSFLAIPLRFKKDVLGVINFSRSEVDGFSENDIRFLTLVANQIALAMENADLYTKTRELAVRDELLGIYNRRHFQQVMQMEWKRATRFKRPLSLIMVDVDHFKDFNDTFGHLTGDRVLKAIAEMLNKNLREVDTLARFGGEEFVVLLPDTDKAGALVVGEKLRRIVERERFDNQNGVTMSLTISAGIAVFPQDAKEMDDLIDHADVALYDAKDSGRNKVVLYGIDPAVSDEVISTPIFN